MKKSAKRSIIVSAVLAIIMCVSLAAGATFALFTSESKVNISVSSGKVNVVATVEDLKTYSGKDLTGKVEDDKDKIYKTDNTEVFPGGVNGTFYNGGSAEFSAEDDNTLSIQKMTPGDKVTFDIKVENKSNVAIKYRTIIMCEEDNGLFSGLTITLKEGETASAEDDDEVATEETAEAEVYDGRTVISKWTLLEAGAKFNPDTVHVEIELPSDRDNEYQDTSCKLYYKVEAVQGNAQTVDYALEIYNVADLMYFRQNASEIKGTVVLQNDIDLDGAEWDPINWNVNDGSVFDGQEHTVSNFVVKENTANPSGESSKKDLGLFGGTTGIHINNLKVNKATVSGIGRVGAIVGNGLCTYIDNCVVTNSKITAKVALNTNNKLDDGDKAGAVAGRISAEGKAQITNCTVISCTVQAYRDLGGLAGHVQFSGANVQNNKVLNTTIIWDLSSGLEETNTMKEIVGRQDGTHSNGTYDPFVLDTTTNTCLYITVETLKPVYNVNPSNVQDCLDGKLGSLTDATVVLAEGDYGTLYLRQNGDASTRRPDLDKDTTTYPAYYRAFMGLTIKSQEGANVTCGGVKVEAGLFNIETAPASNKNATTNTVGTKSGFISYIGIQSLTIQGINFNNTEQSAIDLRDNVSSEKTKGSSLYVMGLTVKDCTGVGDTSNENVHFFKAGDGTADVLFQEWVYKGFSDITIEGCTMTNYYQPICWNNETATLTNLTVSKNTFVSCTNNIVQVSNKANCGTFTFDSNKLIKMNGRFIRLANVQAGATIIVNNTTVESPIDYDNSDKGEIVKVTGDSGFTVQNNNGKWSVKENTDSTTYILNGDTSLISKT